MSILRCPVAVFTVVLLSSQVFAADICKAPSQMTLSGKVRQIQSLREEPQADVESWFWVDLAAPLCGKKSVSASVIGTVPCSEGDAIALSGEFSPPGPTTDTARIRVHPGSISCTPAH